MLGIDISYHNGKLDFEYLKNCVDFIIIRCGYGIDLKSQDDTMYARNVSECKKLEIPFGVYLYSYADSLEKAESECEHIKRLLNGDVPPCGIWYDLEEARNADFFTKAAIVFDSKFEKYLHGVYASKYHMTYFLDKIPGTCKRWVAHWNTQACGYDRHPFLIWQYTSSGEIKGITGKRFDFNIAPEFWKKEELTLDKVVERVIAGFYGNGEERKKRITEETPFRYTEVQKIVNEKLKQEKDYYPVPSTDARISIVDSLKAIEVDSSFANRKKIAEKNGITDYKGTAEQNQYIIKMLYNGKLRRI